MKPTNPAVGNRSAVARLMAEVPTARLLGSFDPPIPDGWTSEGNAADLVVALRGRADLESVTAALSAVRRSDDGPERIWVVAPNPAPSTQILALLSGARADLDGHFIADLDQALARNGWCPTVGGMQPSTAEETAVRGGLGAFLDQLASVSGIGGHDDHLVRCYRPAMPTTNDAPARPFLSVLVRTQGAGLRQQTIRDTLVCLAAQTDLDIEVLVLAHRVGESERRALGETIAQFEPLLPGRLRILEVSEPGRATPLGVGAAAARGDYLAILDDDDTVLAHWVESFHNLARRTTHPAVLRARSASQRMEVLDRGNGDVGYRAWTAWDTPWSARFDLLEQLADNHMPIHSYALPRSALAGWGLTWDKDLPVLEDWDLLMRAVNVFGVVDGGEFTSIYRLWPTALNSQGVTDTGTWAAVREGLLDRWDLTSWIAPPGTVRHAVRAEFALLADRPLADRVRGRVQRLAKLTGPTLIGTPLGRLARKAYRRSGLRPPSG